MAIPDTTNLAPDLTAALDQFTAVEEAALETFVAKLDEKTPAAIFHYRSGGSLGIGHRVGNGALEFLQPRQTFGRRIDGAAMRVALFCHSLLSDWNHGNAHFLRGIVTELVARGQAVRVFEPRDAAV